MKNFWLRLITGVVFIVVVLGSILGKAYSGVFGVFVFIGMLEFYKLLKDTKIKIQVGLGITIGIYLYVITIPNCFEIIKNFGFLLLIPLIISVFITELFRKTETPILNIAATLVMPLYVVLPFIFLINFDDYRLLMGFFIIIWSSDTGAYLVGVKFGKRRLFERISPKKSWEGTIGGFIASLLVAFVLSKFFNNLSLINWLVVGGIISITGVFGDLTESMIKRSVNKKDSGNILPGHGGILDRFDSVTFAAPMVYCYLMLINYL